METGFPKRTCDDKEIWSIPRFYLIGKCSSPLVPAKAGTQSWIPAFRGNERMNGFYLLTGSLNGNVSPSGSGMRKTFSVIEIST